jgi:hypothetical protein
MNKGFIFMLDLVFSIVIILIALVFIFDVKMPKVNHMQGDLVFDSANNFYTGNNSKNLNGNVCVDYELYDGTKITNCKVIS